MKQNSAKAVILAVDDVATNIHVIKSILASEFCIQAALDGKMALKIIEKKKPDLVLLDIMMPKMDGYEVCRRLKANPDTAAIPVIFFTARNEEKDEIMGLDLGAVDYITKPVNAAILRARVKTHLGRKQLGQSRNIDMQEDQGLAAKRDVIAKAGEQKMCESLSMRSEQRLREPASIIKTAVKPAKTVAITNSIPMRELIAELESISLLVLNYDPTAEEVVAELLERVENHQSCTALVQLYKYLTDYDFDRAAAHLAKFIRTQKEGEIRL